ncbi:MAG: biotin--[acetyl-CoA-carboxylase] ligase [Gammaproteobacteria bacterium]|nr:biotin--[acetyl-CoA-carboxylase] ligase [Gammaproteobacteria bacterium]
MPDPAPAIAPPDPHANPEKALLLRLARGPVSGDALAREAGLTRAAVWKRIEALRAAGIAIDGEPGRGYALEAPLDLLDAGAIIAALPPSLRAGIHGPEVAWSVDSTNSELLRRPTPARGVAVLLAERQTGGRGRLGRGWASPLAANLYLSLARAFDGGLARLGGLGLVAGVATAEVLRALGFEAVGLKWPNDLVVAGAEGQGLRKLGGLLVEGGGEHAGPVRAVVGLGLNVRMPGAAAGAIDQPWCDLSGLGHPAMPVRTALASALVAGLVAALDRFDREGLAPFLPRYAELDALAGRRVEVRAGQDAFAGEALGLASDGALRVLVDGVERHVHAGEASLRGGPAP